MFYPTNRNPIFGDIDAIFDSFTKPKNYKTISYRSSTPRANVTQDENSYTISLAAPGLARGDFNIEVVDGVLSVSAKESEQNPNALRREFSYHDFSRSWTLPENVIVDSISANYEAGILNLNIPVENVTITKTKKIEVQ